MLDLMYVLVLETTPMENEKIEQGETQDELPKTSDPDYELKMFFKKNSHFMPMTKNSGVPYYYGEIENNADGK
jgi:hypothetical protein